MARLNSTSTSTVKATKATKATNTLLNCLRHLLSLQFSPPVHSYTFWSSTFRLLSSHISRVVHLNLGSYHSSTLGILNIWAGETSRFFTEDRELIMLPKVSKAIAVAMCQFVRDSTQLLLTMHNHAWYSQHTC